MTVCDVLFVLGRGAELKRPHPYHGSEPYRRAHLRRRRFGASTDTPVMESVSSPVSPSLPATLRGAGYPHHKGGGHPDAAPAPEKRPTRGTTAGPGSLTGGSKSERPVHDGPVDTRQGEERAGTGTCRTGPAPPVFEVTASSSPRSARLTTSPDKRGGRVDEASGRGTGGAGWWLGWVFL